MSIAAESATLLFVEWAKEHPEFDPTPVNGSRIATYLRENHLVVSWKNFDKAYAALKAAGQVDILKTPAQVEAERIEKVRQIIYAEVNAKLAPARIDFTNPVVFRKIATYLHAKENGLMSTDRVLRAVEAHKFDDDFWQIPPADLYKSQDYVHGLRNHSKAPTKPEEDSNHPLGRRNHALDVVIDKELKEGFKKVRKGMDEEEGRRIGMVVEHSISGYRAQRFNRIDNVATEIIQGLLRKYAAKHGADVIRVVRELPDDPTSAEAYLRRRL